MQPVNMTRPQHETGLFAKSYVVTGVYDEKILIDIFFEAVHPSLRHRRYHYWGQSPPAYLT